MGKIKHGHHGIPSKTLAGRLNKGMPLETALRLGKATPWEARFGGFLFPDVSDEHVALAAQLSVYALLPRLAVPGITPHSD